MTRREITAAVAVLVVLAGLAAWQRRPREVPPAGPVPVFAEAGPATEAVSVVQLAQEGPDGVTARLERRGDGWVLASHVDAPADAERVGRLLAAVDGLVGEVRTDDPALLPEFRLAGDGVIRLELQAPGQAPTVLWVGAPGPRSNRSFVRPEGDDRAWLAHTPLHSALGLHGRGERPFDPEFFLDLRLFPGEADDVIGIAVQGEQGWGITRDGPGDTWRWEPAMDGPAPAERAATGKAHTAARLRAASLVGVTSEPAHGLAAPHAVITVTTADGIRRELLVGDLAPPPTPEGNETPRESDERFVQVRGQAWIWRARAASLDALSRRPEGG